MAILTKKDWTGRLLLFSSSQMFNQLSCLEGKGTTSETFQAWLVCLRLQLWVHVQAFNTVPNSIGLDHSAPVVKWLSSRAATQSS